MSAGHTPGPWQSRVASNPYTQRDERVVTRGACVIVTLGELRIEAERDANASLIAAAPEMLAVLEMTLPAVEYYDEHEGAFATLTAVRTAIAKAKGVQP